MVEHISCYTGTRCMLLQTVQMHGVYSALYDTVHYEEPLKSCENRVGHSPYFGLHFVAILSQCAESYVKQYLITVYAVPKLEGRHTLHCRECITSYLDCNCLILRLIVCVLFQQQNST